VSPSGLFGSNNFENEPERPRKNNKNNNVSPSGLFGSNNFENEPERPRKNNKNNNVSPSGLFGSNNFEEEPAPAPAPAALKNNNAASVNSANTNMRAAANVLTMNSLSENEKQRVKLMKELNNSLTNKEILNMIRNERTQTSKNLVKDYQKKRQTSRGKRGKAYKGGKRTRRNAKTTSSRKQK
jgi:hypothetical protein